MMAAVFYTPELWSVLLVMVTGGIVGGVVNYFFDPLPPVTPPPAPDPIDPDNRQPVGFKPTYFWRCVVVGIGASFIVPVFLFLTQSKLLDSLLISEPARPKTTQMAPAQDSLAITSPAAATTARPTGLTSPARTTTATAVSSPAQGAPANQPQPDTNDLPLAANYLVFFGLCVVAAISGFRFIPSVTDKVLQLQKVEQKLNQVSQKNTELQKTVEYTKEQSVSNVAEAIRALKHTQSTKERATRGLEMLSDDPKPTTATDDPQKGRWGGLPVRNGYRLSATVTPLDKDMDLFRIRLRVAPADSASTRLSGTVTFHLHDTFLEPTRRVPVIDNQATLELIGWGGFTVGAVTDDGTTLELDLADPAQLPDAPTVFRER